MVFQLRCHLPTSSKMISGWKLLPLLWTFARPQGPSIVCCKERWSNVYILVISCKELLTIEHIGWKSRHEPSWICRIDIQCFYKSSLLIDTFEGLSISASIWFPYNIDEFNWVAEKLNFTINCLTSIQSIPPRYIPFQFLHKIIIRTTILIVDI